MVKHVDLVELEGALHREYLLRAVRELHALLPGWNEGAFKAGFETCLEELEIRMRILCESHAVTEELLAAQKED